ncbi:alpha/beta-hydrolase [Atractiella rhizophila]|nr:alpha/beta-hydrolase [Atractiella rhizophila]
MRASLSLVSASFLLQVVAAAVTFTAQQPLAFQTETNSVNGGDVSIVTHPAFKDHRIRLVVPEDACPTKAKQWAGYLDVSANNSHHMFFWYFESERDPENDPLVIWFAGGPGTSGLLSVFGGTGPCLFNEHGNGTFPNPYSWNNVANLIIVDQPVGVGFSYFDEGAEPVSDSFRAGKDIYAFLQLFYKRFPSKWNVPLTLAGGSYGGAYVPTFAHVIFEENQKKSTSIWKDELVYVPMETLAIGNGLSNFGVQLPLTPEWACDVHGLFDEQECAIMKRSAPICAAAFKNCLDFDFDKAACFPAAEYCQSTMLGPAMSKNISVYDITEKCAPEECFISAFNPLIKYLNSPETRKKLKLVPDSIKWEPVSYELSERFVLAGDEFYPHSDLLAPLVTSGIRVIAYIGDWDMICHWLGNLRWMLDLPTPFQSEFAVAEDEKIFFQDKLKATIRTAGQGAGNFAFVRIFEAGHGIVGYQPAFTVWMLENWLQNTEFKSQSTGF